MVINSPCGLAAINELQAMLFKFVPLDGKSDDKQ
jgi:hypothetical protein